MTRDIRDVALLAIACIALANFVAPVGRGLDRVGEVNVLIAALARMHDTERSTDWVPLDFWAGGGLGRRG
jgi:hypothetical protein